MLLFKKKIRKETDFAVRGDICTYNALLKKGFWSYTTDEKDMNTLCSLLLKVVDYWFISFFNGSISTFTIMKLLKIRNCCYVTASCKEELMNALPVLNATKAFVTKAYIALQKE
jgi:hypothetical protein